jgi:hypothetical protein
LTISLRAEDLVGLKLNILPMSPRAWRALFQGVPEHRDADFTAAMRTRRDPVYRSVGHEGQPQHVFVPTISAEVLTAIHGSIGSDGADVP